MQNAKIIVEVWGRWLWPATYVIHANDGSYRCFDFGPFTFKRAI